MGKRATGHVPLNHYILYMYSKNKFHDEFCNLKINSQVND